MDGWRQGRHRDAALFGPLHGTRDHRVHLYYIHTSPDFMDSYADIADNKTLSVLPEVGFE